MQIYFTELWYNIICSTLKQVRLKRGVFWLPKMWGCGSGCQELYSHILSGKTLCSNHPSEASANDCSSLKVFHLWTWRQLFCLYSYIKLSQVEENIFCRLWLCSFYQETSVMHWKACKYETFYKRFSLPKSKIHTHIFFLFWDLLMLKLTTAVCMANFQVCLTLKVLWISTAIQKFTLA